MRFEWDENKNKENKIKHDVTFEEAQTVFLHKIEEIPDVDHSRLECRFITYGISCFGRELFVSYCYRNKNIRIISARKANKNERREIFYER